VVAAELADRIKIFIYLVLFTVIKINLSYTIKIRIHFPDAKPSLFQMEKKKEMGK
jgi:hypothetical protein